MDSTVKKLAEESGLWSYLEGQNPGLDCGVALEKFAELVVAECIDAVNTMNLGFLYTTYDISIGNAVLQNAVRRIKIILGDSSEDSDCQ